MLNFFKKKEEPVKEEVLEQPTVNQSEQPIENLQPEEEKLTGGLFNPLENVSVNMETNDNQIKIDSFDPSDNVELLDDLTPKSDYKTEVISKINGLNLDLSRVNIQEIDLPNEYQVIIKIKK